MINPSQSEKSDKSA